MPSKVWEYFNRPEENEMVCTINQCGKSYNHHLPSVARLHIRDVHPEIFPFLDTKRRRTSSSDNEPTKRSAQDPKAQQEQLLAFFLAKPNVSINLVRDSDFRRLVKFKVCFHIVKFTKN